MKKGGGGKLLFEGKERDKVVGLCGAHGEGFYLSGPTSFSSAPVCWETRSNGAPVQIIPASFQTSLLLTPSPELDSFSSSSSFPLNREWLNQPNRSRAERMDGRTDGVQPVSRVYLFCSPLFKASIMLLWAHEMNGRRRLSRLSEHKRVYFLVYTGPTWRGDGPHPAEPLCFVFSKRRERNWTLRRLWWSGFQRVEVLQMWRVDKGSPP